MKERERRHIFYDSMYTLEIPSTDSRHLAQCTLPHRLGNPRSFKHMERAQAMQ